MQNTKKTEAPVNLYYVDDDELDQKIVKRALRNADAHIELTTFNDPQLAFDYFENNKNKLRTEASILLVDINLPGMSGLELLAKIRTELHINWLPVFIFSSSNRAEDVTQAYNNGASAVMDKGKAGVQFEHLAELLNAFSLIGQFPDGLRDW